MTIQLHQRELSYLRHLFGHGQAGIDQAERAITSSDADIPRRLLAKLYLHTERPAETGLAHDKPAVWRWREVLVSMAFLAIVLGVVVALTVAGAR